MDLGRLLAYFQTSPALRLLRSQNAPFIIDFLNKAFKQSGRAAIPQDELRVALTAYQAEVSEIYPDRFIGSAEKYLADWCSPETLWLRRFLGAFHEQPLYQLTPATEDVFVFLQRVLNSDREFIGTESRLQLVIGMLSDLAVRSSDDPQGRLAHLAQERERLEAEAKEIVDSGRVAKYQPAQIRERFGTAVSLLRELQGDFRGVEESFRDIAVQVQQRQGEAYQSRGGILEFALDAEDVLKRGDQGVSFFEFVRLILSPSEMERVERVIQAVRRIPELESQYEGLEAIRTMSAVLQLEADKVMRTNQRLSATLRRLLDWRAQAERQQVAKVLRQIRGYAIELAPTPPADVGCEIEVSIEMNIPGRRTFWSPPREFEATPLTLHAVSDAERRDAFRRLAALGRLEWKELRRRVRQCAATENGATLGDVLAAHPPVNGVVELLAYLQIAHEDHHVIDTGSNERVLMPPDGVNKALLITIPLVIFEPRSHGEHAR